MTHKTALDFYRVAADEMAFFMAHDYSATS
jgi:hypothetical protein